MTYSTGNIIQASDYNNFVANVNTTWNTFYGQTALSNVAASGTVTATQWTTLFNTITNMAGHSNTTLSPALPSVSAGNTIVALANVANAISNCTTNQANAATRGTQYTAWTGNVSSTGAFSSVSSWTITTTSTVTFANSTAATNFFNGGGLIQIAFSKTSTGQTGDSTWNTFVGNGPSSVGTAGVIYLSGTAASKTIAGNAYTGTTKIGGSGSPATLATGTGYANLTTSTTTLFKQNLTATGYANSYVQVQANVVSNALNVITTWYDKSGNNLSGGTATSGITYGTAPATTVTYFPPETTYLTNTWGTPTVTSSITTSNTTPSYSVLFTGDQCMLANGFSADFNSAFTWEAWIYPNLMNNGWLYGSNDNCVDVIYLSSSNYWGYSSFNCSGANQNSNSGSVTAGAWYHVAQTRDSTGNTNIWLNGVINQNITVSGGALSSSESFFNNINHYLQPNPPGNAGFSGYCAGVRISNTNIYTTSFTPAKLTVTANTVGLWCTTSNPLADISSGNHPFTAYGNGGYSGSTFVPPGF